jgi:hypothetical protein
VQFCLLTDKLGHPPTVWTHDRSHAKQHMH